MRFRFLLALVLALVPTFAMAADDRFGVVFVNPPDRVASEARLNQAAALGAGWDRYTLYWSQIQPARNGAFDFSRIDAVVAANQGRGIKTQGILLGAPEWAVSGGKLDLDAWSRFVGAATRQYKGRVTHWEMWNEPDLLDGDGRGRYWPWSIEEYAGLLRAGYLSAKEADPGVTVLMAGLAMPFNNERFFDRLLEILAKDPNAAKNGWYFDALPIHVYDRVARVYELPHGYLGYPSFAGFHALMKRRGFDRPIWVNELGVPIWDESTGQRAPGRATRDEQASFVLQAFAYGLAAGNQRHLFFQLYDDGAGAIDPRTNTPAEFFGLVANDGTTRPAYQTYRTALDLFADGRLTTRINLGRIPSKRDGKGLELISTWGTTRGRVTVAFNADGGPAVEARIPAIAATANVLDKFGRSRGTIAARDGAYTVSLPAATNNNNFDCYTPRGCDPNDYIVGGDPVVLVENDRSVPSVTFDPLPSAAAVPLGISWRGTRALAAGTRFDVEYQDVTERSGWRPWLVATDVTRAAFGGETPVTRDRVYAFRARITGEAWPAAPLASIYIVGGQTWPPPKAEVDATIQIVWPHGNAPVASAKKANLAINVFRAGSAASVGPQWGAPPRLLRAIDNDVEQEVGIARARVVKRGALEYPLWEVNDVDVAAANDPNRKVYFRLAMDGKREATSVWAHGADGRTILPKPKEPVAVLAAMPAAVDARIQIVWPHGGAPVEKADRANIAAYLFEQGGDAAIPTTFDGQVILYRSINNGPGEPVALGDKELRSVGGVTYPRWIFNDIDVSAARDKSARIFFRVEVSGVPYFANVWAHAADARTFVPKPLEPTSVAP